MIVATEDNGHDVDDCWNRIGIQGNGTCQRLQAHIHCRNCEVYSAAARSLLDVALPRDHLPRWTSHIAKPREQSEQGAESVVIFRSGAERLALPTAVCKEVVSQPVVRTVPHRRSSALLGLANIRGELVVCVSLCALLGIEPAADSGTRRLLIVDGQDAPTALQVDEVQGTHRFHARDLARARATPAAASATANAEGPHIRAILRWRDHTIGVIDERALLASVARALT